jgi:spectinomycin phosphotransferase
MVLLMDLEIETICVLLHKEYGIIVSRIEQLFLGADKNTRTYKVNEHNKEYFLKIRINDFNELSLLVPHWLSNDKKLKNIIHPITTLDGKLYSKNEPFSIILYPFIHGEAGWDRFLSKKQWYEFGEFFSTLHNTSLPDSFANSIPKETYSSRSRINTRKYLEEIKELRDGEPEIEEYKYFMLDTTEIINKMIDRAEEIVQEIEPNNKYCLCHGDIHAGNIVLNDGELFIVDWDTLIFAPKERDLMFIGGGIGNRWNTEDEVKNFYEGYKDRKIDKKILTYYRYERIIEDLEDYHGQLFDSFIGHKERKSIIDTIKSQFTKNDVVDIAFRTDGR